MPDMPSSAEQPAKAIAPATAARSRAIRKMFSFIEDLSAECGQAGALGSAYLVRSVSRIARHVRQTDSSTRDRETRRLLAGITAASRRVANGNACGTGAVSLTAKTASTVSTPAGRTKH